MSLPQGELPLQPTKYTPTSVSLPAPTDTSALSVPASGWRGCRELRGGKLGGVERRARGRAALPADRAGPQEQ